MAGPGHALAGRCLVSDTIHADASSEPKVGILRRM
jgi:hypothetical protein